LTRPGHHVGWIVRMRPRTVVSTNALWRCRLTSWPAMVVLGCVVFVGIAPAQAEKGDPRENKARAECLAGRVQTGIDLLAELFTETHNMTYVYNQGRCFEQNGMPHEAILRFKEFLRKGKDLSAEEKAEVTSHVNECQAELDAQSKSSQPLPRAVEKPEPVAAMTPPPSPSPVSQTAGAAPASPPAPPGAGLRMAGIVTGSAGAAVLVGGVIFGVLSHQIANEVTSDDAKGIYSKSKDDKGKLYADLQWVGYGVGAAGLVAGGVLYYLGYRKAHSPASESVSFVPVIWQGGSGVVAQGRF
jgi:hypothetical protein